MSSTKLVVIPDLQVKPGRKQTHLCWAAGLVNQESPDGVIQLGDWGDMPSLSVYDRGKKRAEGARYQRDIDSTNDSVDLFESGLRRFRGEKHMLLGNHEQRIERHVEAFPHLEGKLSYDDFNFKDHGWEVHPFLQPLDINGVLFSHYFPKTSKGTVTGNSARMGAGSAELQVKGNMCSTVAGHKQGFSYYEHPSGKQVYQGVIAGSFYTHDEHYLGTQGNDYWRGVLVFHFRSHRSSYFDIEKWSLWRLKEKFGAK